jgi:hypothetical protein
MTLPPCGARHDLEPEKGAFFCANPRILSKHFIVTAGFCRMCPLKDLPLPARCHDDQGMSGLL